MPITRIGTTRRWSDAVIHNNTVYLVEVPSNLNGDISGQTHDILSLIEVRLNQVGSSKTDILMATIYLRDISQINEFNQIWDEWLIEGSAPSRACIQAVLANPQYLVEIQIIAAISG